jgi:hypothetical protein
VRDGFYCREHIEALEAGLLEGGGVAGLATPLQRKDARIAELEQELDTAQQEIRRLKRGKKRLAIASPHCAGADAYAGDASARRVWTWNSTLLTSRTRRTATSTQSDNVTEGRDWPWQDTPEDIAATILRLYPDKAIRGSSQALAGYWGDREEPTMWHARGFR